MLVVGLVVGIIGQDLLARAEADYLLRTANECLASIHKTNGYPSGANSK